MPSKLKESAYEQVKYPCSDGKHCNTVHDPHELKVLYEGEYKGWYCYLCADEMPKRYWKEWHRQMMTLQMAMEMAPSKAIPDVPFPEPYALCHGCDTNEGRTLDEPTWYAQSDMHFGYDGKTGEKRNFCDNCYMDMHGY